MSSTGPRGSIASVLSGSIVPPHLRGKKTTSDSNSRSMPHGSTSNSTVTSNSQSTSTISKSRELLLRQRRLQATTAEEFFKKDGEIDGIVIYDAIGSQTMNKTHSTPSNDENGIQDETKFNSTSGSVGTVGGIGGGGAGTDGLTYENLSKEQENMFLRTLYRNAPSIEQQRSQEKRQLSTIETKTCIKVRVCREDYPDISTTIELSFFPSTAQKIWNSFLLCICEKLQIDFVYLLMDRSDKSPIYRILRLKNNGEYIIRQRESSCILEILNYGRIPIESSWLITKEIINVKKDLNHSLMTSYEMNQRIEEIIQLPYTNEYERNIARQILDCEKAEMVIQIIISVYYNPLNDESSLKKKKKRKKPHGVAEISLALMNLDFSDISIFESRIDMINLHRLSLEQLARLALVNNQQRQVVRFGIVYILKVLRELRHEVDIAIISLQLLSNIVLGLSEFRDGVYNAVLDCLQYYAPEAPLHRSRRPLRLFPDLIEKRESGIMGWGDIPEEMLSMPLEETVSATIDESSEDGTAVSSAESLSSASLLPMYKNNQVEIDITRRRTLLNELPQDKEVLKLTRYPFFHNLERERPEFRQLEHKLENSVATIEVTDDMKVVIHEAVENFDPQEWQMKRLKAAGLLLDKSKGGELEGQMNDENPTLIENEDSRTKFNMEDIGEFPGYHEQVMHDTIMEGEEDEEEDEGDDVDHVKQATKVQVNKVYGKGEENPISTTLEVVKEDTPAIAGIEDTPRETKVIVEQTVSPPRRKFVIRDSRKAKQDSSEAKIRWRGTKGEIGKRRQLDDSMKLLEHVRSSTADIDAKKSDLNEGITSGRSDELIDDNDDDESDEPDTDEKAPIDDRATKEWVPSFHSPLLDNQFVDKGAILDNTAPLANITDSTSDASVRKIKVEHSAFTCRTFRGLTRRSGKMAAGQEFFQPAADDRSAIHPENRVSALSQTFATLVKLLSTNFGNREWAFKHDMAGEMGEVVVVCPSVPRLAEYYVEAIDTMYAEGFTLPFQALQDEEEPTFPSMQLSTGSLDTSSAGLSFKKRPDKHPVGWEQGDVFDAMSELSLPTINPDVPSAPDFPQRQSINPEVPILGENEAGVQFPLPSSAESRNSLFAVQGHDGSQEGSDEDGDEHHVVPNNVAAIPQLFGSARLGLNPRMKQYLAFREAVIAGRVGRLGRNNITAFAWRYVQTPSEPVLIAISFAAHHEEVGDKLRETAHYWIRIWDDQSKEYEAVIRKGKNLIGLSNA